MWVIILCRDVRNIQRRNLAESFSETQSRTSSSRDSFAFKQRASVTGQWASEKNVITENMRPMSAGTGKTTEITEDTDFGGNP